MGSLHGKTTYFAANDVEAEANAKRRAILLSVCGPTTFRLIRDLVTPERPTVRHTLTSEAGPTASPTEAFSHIQPFPV